MKRDIEQFWFLLGLVLWFAAGQGSPAEERPNILWITVEDMSPHLGCYGDPYARTPNIDRFATESIRYTHAFAASPVCSPSRSCLITGRYPVSNGTHQMRSEFPLPETIHGFPYFLRQAGYFTTNNVKTDYNTSAAARLIAESWDLSSDTAHWRDTRRRPGQPFFAVFNDMTTHQSRSMSWPYDSFQKHVQSRLRPEEIHDPAQAEVPPYYPDTPVVRRTLARYADCITLMDQHTGRILAELEEDGLAENTIVFFFSDHGAGLPRHKRMLRDSGMRVPLLIRFPAKFRHLAPGAPGSTTDRLVSFVDFAPTVLSLAGVALPEQFQGVPFAGSQAAAPRDFVYGSRDRVDEAWEMMRSFRDKRYLYIRNFSPLISHNQPEAYSDTSEIRQEITAWYRAQPEAASQAQRDYAGPTKPAEAFYDTANDPHQIHNLLVGGLNGEQASALERFRADFKRYRSRIGDRGAWTEDSLWRWVRSGKTWSQEELETVWACADLVGSSDAAAILPQLHVADPDQRYWGVQALRSAGFADLDRIAPLLEDPALPVRFEAARWLGGDDNYRDRAVAALVDGLGSSDWWNVLHACRGIELLGERSRVALPAMRALYDRTRRQDGDPELFLAFSSGAWLEALGEEVIAWDFSPEAGPFRVPSGTGKR